VLGALALPADPDHDEALGREPGGAAMVIAVFGFPLKRSAGAIRAISSAVPGPIAAATVSASLRSSPTRTTRSPPSTGPGALKSILMGRA
jgi:hypothetical protein